MKLRYTLLPVFLVAVGYLIYWAFFQRESSNWAETVRFSNGTDILVRQHASQRIYHGHPHVFGWGGGHPTQKMQFEFNRTLITWQGPYIPIALNAEGTQVYLAVFDRETDFSRISYRLYQYGGGTWLEIQPSKFPRRLAIQNLWLKEGDGVIARALNTADAVFRSSLTAKLWLKLDKDVDYYNAPHEVDKVFLDDYKRRYFGK